MQPRLLKWSTPTYLSVGLKCHPETTVSKGDTRFLLSSLVCVGTSTSCTSACVQMPCYSLKPFLLSKPNYKSLSHHTGNLVLTHLIPRQKRCTYPIPERRYPDRMCQSQVNGIGMRDTDNYKKMPQSDISGHWNGYFIIFNIWAGILVLKYLYIF